MATVVEDPRKAPTKEIGTSAVYPATPAWGAFTSSLTMQPLELIPELRWPLSVRITFPRMRNDTQLSGLYRGTTLPITRYVWGIDPNGADPEIVDQVCAEMGLQTIDDAWQAYLTGQSDPVKRQRNKFSFSRFQDDALKACYLGNYFFEQVYDIEQDHTTKLNDGWFAHLRKLAPRAPWTISEGGIRVDPDGGLQSVRQDTQAPGEPPIPVTQLVAFVFQQDPGDWIGHSLFRPCFREWLSKDLLYRIDTVNHEKAGGVLITEAPPGASEGQIGALSEMSAAMRVGGGGAVPSGANPLFLRATGSDVIASINQRDEAMARAFLMMFMSLGTSSSGGNRALGSSFIDWFAIAQESIAIWFRDITSEHVIKDFVDLNWDAPDYVPRLVFRRPEDANPVADLTNLAATSDEAGAPGATAVVDPETGKTVPVAAGRLGKPGAVVVDGAYLEQLRASHVEFERSKKPMRYKPVSAAASALPLPDRALRREPTAMEVKAAVDFKQIDDNWQSQVDSLVAAWAPIRDAQIDQLIQSIEAAGGDLTTIATISAGAAGSSIIAARLKAMAQLGAAEAVAEASRQGASTATPELTALEAELETRAAALELLLASSITQAAATKAVQLTGGSLTPSEVAAGTRDYLQSLTDRYLADQFGGALSAAQNAGRMAAMKTNNASSYYASELLDVNTCQPCEDVDGTEYSSAEEAAKDYPAGGYRDCSGGPRCRGSVIAVYDEAEPSA